MQSTYARLTKRALEIRDQCEGTVGARPRRMIIVSGPPGSGKSTVAAEVVKRLNTTASEGEFATVLPMDGFHLTLNTLRMMSNHEEAMARRGIYWTFDAHGVMSLLSALHRTRYERSTIHLAPAFDHASKDPMADAIRITPDIGLIIVEGNWLLYNEQPWSRTQDFADDTWFVDVDEGVALKRVTKRHVECGIEPTWEQADSRARQNDLANGRLIRSGLVPPKVWIRSVDE